MKRALLARDKVVVLQSQPERKAEGRQSSEEKPRIGGWESIGTTC